jgi:hypothetical protein
VLDALLGAFEDDESEDGGDSDVPANAFDPDLLLSTIAAIRVQFVELWRWFEAHGVYTAWNGKIVEVLRACQRCPQLLLAQTVIPATGDCAPYSWLELNLQEVVNVTITRTGTEYGVESKEMAVLEDLASALGLRC